MNPEERNLWCFGCSKLNPSSLKLDFREENDKYIACFLPGPHHQGYEGMVHRGIISTLLDEIMARYPYIKGMNTVTARLEVRFLQPTPIGPELTVTGWMTNQRGKLIELASTVALPDGTVTAEGKATVMDTESR